MSALARGAARVTRALGQGLEKSATGAERRNEASTASLPTTPQGPASAESAAPPKSASTEPAPKSVPVGTHSRAPMRVYAKTRFVWIRDRPSWRSPWLGYLFPGESVEMKSLRPVYAIGCEVWYEVMPHGFVCVDGKRATLDPADRGYRTVAAYTPDYSAPEPHRYAESLGAERYDSPPSHEEQRAREADLTHHLEMLRLARSGEPPDITLLGVDVTLAAEEATPFDSLPVDVRVRRNTLKKDSAIAYAAEYRHDDRSFLLTPDFAWVPKDRVRPYEPVTFHGVTLDGSAKLPLAFFRERDRPQYSKSSPGGFEPNGATFPRLGWVELTGREEPGGDDTYLETSIAGVFVKKSDAVVPTPAERTPWGSMVGLPDDDPNRPSGRATWVDISIYGGWLVAYEGTYPVYATMISPGRGGAPHGRQSPLLTASTPIGRFAVNGKFVTATMDAPGGVTHTDVPWTQNFSGPHAIHSAYWHDAWGERVSGGCVNVSPADGFWLFRYSEPDLPAGWHGVRADPRFDSSTIVMIHR